MNVLLEILTIELYDDVKVSFAELNCLRNMQ